MTPNHAACYLDLGGPQCPGKPAQPVVGDRHTAVFAKRPLFKRGGCWADCGDWHLPGTDGFARSWVGIGVAVVHWTSSLSEAAAPCPDCLVLVLALPWTQEYVTHFMRGFRARISHQMRFGEYKDAFVLISRYPILGVGFAGSPDIDTYIGVASIYFLIAEEMGLVGLTVSWSLRDFLLCFLDKTRTRPHELRAGALWYGLHAAMLGGLVGGVFDH